MNAYFGLGMALEALDDVPGVLGGMRTYVDRSPEGDPFMCKAHGAIWEWEEKLAQSELPKTRSRSLQQGFPKSGSP